ncbi:hypothetical protein LTR85_005751 [Meristemomyces frigidus]|nr:hypothetical protein LTR85_005751 [Meristemomyces frigidus]
MPGSSLWLVPPEDSELYKAIYELIVTDVPSVYPAKVPHFTPHITLTSDVTIPDTEDSQKWLEGIKLPDTKALKVAIRQAEVGSIFFKKITMRCDKTPELCALAASCRAAGVQGNDAKGAQKWAEERSDMPEDEVEAKLDDVHKKVQEAKQQHPDSITAKGGSVLLVPTHKPIEEWKSIAVRQLPEMEWTWHT